MACQVFEKKSIRSGAEYTEEYRFADGVATRILDLTTPMNRLGEAGGAAACALLDTVTVTDPTGRQLDNWGSVFRFVSEDWVAPSYPPPAGAVLDSTGAEATEEVAEAEVSN